MSTFGATLPIEGMEEGGKIYVGFCFSMKYGTKEWMIMSGTDEADLKKDMVDEGAHPEYSYVVCVTLPSTKEAKEVSVNIRTMDLKDVGGEKVAH